MAAPVLQEVRPTTIASPAANYAHAIVINVPSRMMHTSGVVPVRLDGSVPETVEEQADVVWENILQMLQEVGWGPSNVVSVTTYVVVGENLSNVMKARDKHLKGHRAASTLVTVPALARAEWRMEISVVAAGP
jgi:2-iminobutanoate/2-iminopropanoate deaminase